VTWEATPEQRACCHAWGEEGRGRTFSPQRDNSGGLVNNRRDTRGEQSWSEGTTGASSTGATCRRCGTWKGELGSEGRADCLGWATGAPCHGCYLCHLLMVFEAVKRVLRPDGLCVVNLGDSYAAGGGYWPDAPSNRNGSKQSRYGVDGSGTTQYKGRKPPPGIPAKSLMLVPQSFVLAMRAHGWIPRSAAPWIKRSAMPESTRDRPTVAHETVFLFAKSPRYFWDDIAVRRTGAEPERQRWERIGGANGHTVRHSEGGMMGASASRNLRTTDCYFDALDADIAAARAHLAHLQALRTHGGVATDDEGVPVALDINPEPYAGAHFASFPQALVRPWVLAGCPERCCAACGRGWERITERTTAFGGGSGRAGNVPNGKYAGTTQAMSGRYDIRMGPQIASKTLDWRPSCACQDDRPPVPGVCLDPFAGSGTTGVVAEALGRDCILIELSESYVPLIEQRLAEARAERLFPAASNPVETMKRQLALGWEEA
jgi:site-specific DNA-methyltransferase (adenine-specific)